MTEAYTEPLPQQSIVGETASQLYESLAAKTQRAAGHISSLFRRSNDIVLPSGVTYEAAPIEPMLPLQIADRPIDKPVNIPHALRRGYDQVYGRLCVMSMNQVLGKEQVVNRADSNHRREIGIIAVGAVILTAAGAYGASKGFTGPKQPHNLLLEHHLHHHTNKSNTHHNHMSHHTKHHNQHKPKLRERVTKIASEAKYSVGDLKKNSNLWLESKKELGKHATLQAIAKRDDLLLKLNHLTETSARHMKIGYRYIYPRAK